MNVFERIKGWQQASSKRFELNQIPLILHRMNEGALPRQTLVEVIKIRYQVAHFFEDMLEHMLRIIRARRFWRKDGLIWPDVATAFEHAVAENLKDERGEVAEYGGPHREGRSVFLTALGVDYRAWATPLGSYGSLGSLDEFSSYVITQLQHIIEYGAVEALGILWCYERAISRDGRCGDYCIMLRAFERAFPEFAKVEYHEGDALWHIASHAQHDSEHARLAAEALAALDDKPGLWPESMQLGIKTAYLTNLNFWNGLSERFCGAFDSRAHWRHPDRVL